MTNDAKAVVCCIDGNYSRHCAAMLVSLFERNPGERFRVFFVCENVGKIDQEKLNVTVTQYGHTCRFLEIDGTIFEGVPLGAHIPVASYFKIIMAKVIPPDVEKVLYLDADLIVRKNIKALWEVDVNDYLVAAVENLSLTANALVKSKLGLPEHAKYFNAGVLLVNAGKWREEGVFEQSLQYIRENLEKITWHDQDVLNVVAAGRWYAVDPTWNVQHNVFGKQGREKLCIPKQEYDQLERDPSIVHFSGSGSHKPWHYDCQHPFKDEYWAYVKKTAWRQSGPIGRPGPVGLVKAKVKSILRKGMKFLGHQSEGQAK